MTRQVINLGTGPDSGDGDTLREGGRKINENFGELYAAQILTSTDQLPEGLLNKYYTEARVTARFNSAALTGTPTATTAAAPDNSTQIATTAFVKSQNYVTALTAPVTSVFGRMGAIVAALGDYTAALISYVATAISDWVGGVSPSTAASALDILAADNRGSVTFNYVTDADATLSIAQNNHAQLIITGAVLTAPRNLIVETRVHRFWVRNSTARTITVKTAAGTGVAILAGNSKNIACDGANVVLSTMLASETTNTPANGNTGTTVQAAIDQTINISSTAQQKTGQLNIGSPAGTGSNRETQLRDFIVNVNRYEISSYAQYGANLISIGTFLSGSTFDGAAKLIIGRGIKTNNRVYGVLLRKKTDSAEMASLALSDDGSEDNVASARVNHTAGFFVAATGVDTALFSTNGGLSVGATTAPPANGLRVQTDALIGARAALGGALSTQTVAAFLKVYGRTELTDAIQPAARTVATLPAASGYPAGYTFYCSNARTGRDAINTPQDGVGSGAGCLVTSNGTNWLTPTGLTASA